MGTSRTGPIEAFLPVMLFAILFGLSMDYQVFLVSRIHEEHIKSGDNRVAVRNGLAATGKTITAAALIMILVFGSFILGGQRVIKEFGIGLAGGIFVDAVLIRMAIVPSVMMLLGKSNWWFPQWLDRILPNVVGRCRRLGGGPRSRTPPVQPIPTPDPRPGDQPRLGEPFSRVTDEHGSSCARVSGRWGKTGVLWRGPPGRRAGVGGGVRPGRVADGLRFALSHGSALP